MSRFALWEDSPVSLLTLLAISSIFLTLIAGLFLVVGALLGAMLTGLATATAGVTPFLLISAIVLLCAVIVLLLLLLYCTGCFTKGRGDRAGLARLLALLPVVGHLKTTLTSLGAALQSIETMLTTVETKLNSTADAVANTDLPSVPVPTFQTESLATVFAGTIVAPVVEAIENTYDDNNSAPYPEMISGFAIEDKEISLAFLNDVFSTEPFADQIEIVSEARVQVQTLANLLP